VRGKADSFGQSRRAVSKEKPLGCPTCSRHDRLVDTYLETERLALRRFTADDADLLIELDRDPAVMRYLTGGEATAPEVVRERDLPNILAGYEKWGGNFGVLAAHEKDSAAFIGWFILRPEPGGPLDEVELGSGCGRRLGARGMPPRARGPCWARRSRSSVCAWSGLRQCPSTMIRAR